MCICASPKWRNFVTSSQVVEIKYLATFLSFETGFKVTATFPKPPISMNATPPKNTKNENSVQSNCSNSPAKPVLYANLSKLAWFVAPHARLYARDVTIQQIPPDADPTLPDGVYRRVDSELLSWVGWRVGTSLAKPGELTDDDLRRIQSSIDFLTVLTERSGLRVSEKVPQNYKRPVEYKWDVWDL